LRGLLFELRSEIRWRYCYPRWWYHSRPSHPQTRGYCPGVRIPPSVSIAERARDGESI